MMRPPEVRAHGFHALGLGLALLCAAPVAHAADGIGGTGVTTHTDGIGGTGITGYGHIERFGSIFVNGREYFLDRRTRVSVDGASATEQQLQLGDVVQVEAQLDPQSGRASAVAVHNTHQVIGIVERVSPSTASISILGQEITLSASTHVQDARNKTVLTLDQIKPGDAIAVSALAHGDQAWTATRLNRLGTARETAQNAAFLLHGAITRIDRDGGRLHVGTQSFALGASQARTLREGQRVVLRGRYGSDAPRVEKIERERPLGKPGTRVEMEGYVHTGNAAQTLSSNGITLHVERGTEQNAITTGAAPRTTVHGRIERDGSIRVEKIEPRVERPERASTPEPQPERAGKEQPAAARREAARTEIDTPSAQKPDLERSEVEKSTLEKPQLQRPEIEKPVMERPEVTRPEVQRPEITRPDVDRPQRSKIERPEIER